MGKTYRLPQKDPKCVEYCNDFLFVFVSYRVNISNLSPEGGNLLGEKLLHLIY
jgi:hypothetical protein